MHIAFSCLSQFQIYTVPEIGNVYGIRVVVVDPCPVTLKYENN